MIFKMLLPNAQFTKKVVTSKYDTQDIIKLVLECYIKDWEQCKGIAKELQMNTVKDTCLSIFNFVADNIKYKEDPSGKQWVKSPARLFEDKVGDCKSFSIFIASCLNCLQIPHVFRFASYTSSSDVTHVYVVAFHNGKEIIIDPVAYIQRSIPFNSELKYISKIDITMEGKELAYLAGVGSADAPQAISYYNEGRNQLNARVSELELFSLIDLKNAYSTLATNDNQVQSLYNEMDVYLASIRLIQKFGSNASLLERAGLFLENYVAAGLFSVNMPTPARVENTESLIAEIVMHVQNGDLPSPILISEFVEWWNYTVMSQNYYQGLDGSTSNTPYSSIGAVANDWSTMVKESSPYLLYSASSEKLTTKAEEKKSKHIQFIDYVRSQNTGLNIATINNIIASGIIQLTGRTADANVALLRSGKIAGIGLVDLTEEKDSFDWNVVINGVTALSGLITSIAGAFGKTELTPTEQAIRTYAPTSSDWGSSSSSTSILTYAIPLGVVGAALLFMKNKKAKARRNA